MFTKKKKIGKKYHWIPWFSNEFKLVSWAAHEFKLVSWATIKTRFVKNRFVSSRKKLVSWKLVSWAAEKNSFRENSFREQEKKLVSWKLVSWAAKKTRFVKTRFVSSNKKLVSWKLVSWADKKTRFVSNFTSLVSKSAHETREFGTLSFFNQDRDSIHYLHRSFAYISGIPIFPNKVTEKKIIIYRGFSGKAPGGGVFILASLKSNQKKNPITIKQFCRF